MYTLKVRDPAGGETTHAIGLGESSTFGRASDCTVQIDDRYVSQHHFVLTGMESGIRILDCSSNGTLVGERLLRREALVAESSVVLRAGRTKIALSVERQAAAFASVPLPRPVQLTPVDVEAPPTPVHPARGSAPAVQLTDKSAVTTELRRQVHHELLRHLELGKADMSSMDAATLRPKVLQALRVILENLPSVTIPRDEITRLMGDLADEALGLGPLESLLADPEVTEIMVVDSQTIFVERAGKCTQVDARFTDDVRARAVIERIITPLGRRIDESSPLVDARLSDGSRVNAIIRPLALRGSCITIRKFPKSRMTLEKLQSFGSVSEQIGRFLTRSVQAKKNVVVSGGTGSGKTTLLNVLSAAIPEHDRIVTIEDSAELQLAQPHVVSLETRPANLEGKGGYSIRDLVKNALRMRPDRIIVGECRGGEALDMLQAMNTGHEGSLTTVHANSPQEALGRIETLCLMAGLDLPAQSIRQQIASSVHLVVQQSRLQDGSRKITAVSEVSGMDHQGRIRRRDLYRFDQTGVDKNGAVIGEFVSTGYLPSYLNELIVRGFIKEGEPFV